MVPQIILCSIGLFISLLAGLYILIKRKNLVMNIKVNEGEIFISGSKKSLQLYLIMFIVTNVGLLALLILSILNLINDGMYMFYIILLLLLSIMSAKWLLDSLFAYVIIKDDIVTSYKLFKHQMAFPVDVIKFSALTNQYVALLDSNKRTILPLAYDHPSTKATIEYFLTKGIEFKKELLDYYKIEHVEVKNEEVLEIGTEESSNDSVSNENIDLETEVKEDLVEASEYSENQIEAFTMIGKDFIENKKKYFIKDIIFAIITQLLVLGLILAFVFSTKQYLFLLLLFINVYMGLSKYKNLKLKYAIEGIDELKLGVKVAHLNKNVKGHHEAKNKMFKSFGIMISVLMIFICIFSGANLFGAKPISYDDMNQIEGKISQITFDNYIVIGITNDNNDYSAYKFAIPNALNSYISTSELVLEPIGSEIVIKTVLNSDSNEKVVYYLKINDKEYITLDHINGYYEDYIASQKKSFGLICGATVIVIGAIVGYIYYNKSQIKKETIDISR